MQEEVNKEKEQYMNDQLIIIQQKDKVINDLIHQVNTLQEEVNQPQTQVVTWETTAYALGDGYTPSNITASGTTPTAGRTVACNWLPFGTQIKIEGHIYTVEDRCGSEVIDIFMDSVEECESWGRRYVEVEIL